MNKLKTLMASLAITICATTAQAGILTIDLAGWVAAGGYFDAGNTSTSRLLPVNTMITGASYSNLGFTSSDDAYNDGLVLSLNDGNIGDYWDTFIAGTHNVQGGFGPVSAAFDNPGILLSTVPLKLTTGQLYVEVYDFTDEGTQTINNGTLRIEYREPGTVPAPATLALFGLGLLGIRWSRRKA